ncbi:hypothetical protein ACTXO6_13425 [Corynebacterium variabile]|uniref:hypothetical protein n=1 Tax=Corynebacterium variabile TaxID=1727 RepID=UPI003FD2B737
MNPTSEELREFMDAEQVEEKTLEYSLAAASGLVDAYCRGNHVNRLGKLRPGVGEVILTVAARLAANPGQVQVREQVGPVSMLVGEGFSGFTLTEQFVLNRYRKRGL